MGKKKPQKTKEISVAIAEASAKGDETQAQTPRKRGRPRKTIITDEKLQDVNEIIAATKQEQEGKGDTGNQSKKAKSSPEKEDAKGTMKEDEKELPRRRSSRKKTKPRKSC